MTKSDRCGLTESGDCLGGCNPKKRCSYPPPRNTARTVGTYEGKVRTIEEIKLPEEEIQLRSLTPAERRVARDPDAWTSAPLPPEGDPSTHPIDCDCIFCIPGA